MSDTRKLIEARDLRRRNPDGAGWLLEGISVELCGRQRLALAGPTGAGKTLLLRALALLDPVDGGELFWRGRPVGGGSVPAFRSRAIYLHQRPALMGDSVEATLQWPFRLKVYSGVQYDEQRIVAWLEGLGRTGDLLRRPTAELSGGERQIVAMLRAIQFDPEVLLLDEPTAALDPSAAESVERLVTEWFEAAVRERAYCWVSHDPQQAARMADRTLRLAAGRIVEPGEKDPANAR
ncbi:MAG: ATP-binding cassette domain-containing protein [Thermoguttaceae bacterium]|nr:ATP-binding cassette domain-containing protein [Thermoguttaceae bacterium]